MKIQYLSALLVGTTIIMTSCRQKNCEEKIAPAAPAEQKVAVQTPVRIPQQADKWTEYKGYAVEFNRLVKNGQSELDALQDILKSNDVIVDFYSDRCGPCKRMAPIFSSVAQKFRNVLFVKVNVDTYRAISDRYNIHSIPTLMYFKNGVRAKEVVGFQTEAEIAQIIQ